MFDKLYNGEIDNFAKVLLKILNDKKYALKTRSEIAGDELYKIVNRSDDRSDVFIIIHDKAALQEVLLHCLQEIIDNEGEYNWKIQEMYLKNLKMITSNNRVIVLTDEANKVMKNLVYADWHNYLKNYFVRKHPEPSFDGQYYFFDPFIAYYFNDDSAEIDRFLKSFTTQFESEEGWRFHEFIDEYFVIPKKGVDNKFLIKDENTLQLLDNFVKPSLN